MSYVSEDELHSLASQVRGMLSGELVKPTLVHRDLSYHVCSRDFVDQLARRVENGRSIDSRLESMLYGQSDLIPNQYEGGFKVWEGLFDLVNYLKASKVIAGLVTAAQQQDQQRFRKVPSLQQQQQQQHQNSPEPIRILDLGCGSGLLSIFLAKELRTQLATTTTNGNTSSAPVRFEIYLQDYNDNVIRYFTIPNVLITEHKAQPELPYSELVSRVASTYHFMHGDWRDIARRLITDNTRFDLIVTAETIYHEANYGKLYSLFRGCLTPNTGRVLLATKSHYFGVGGGTWSFLEFIESKRGRTKKVKTSHFDEKDQNHQQQQQQRFSDEEDSSPSTSYLVGDIVHEIEASLLRHVIELTWSC